MREGCRHLVARVVERRHPKAVGPPDVGAELEQRLRRPVVAARRRRHQRRHVPARLVDGRARLDEEPHHLAVALRLEHTQWGGYERLEHKQWGG